MVYKIISIQEADFGCEERPEGAPAMALVTFEAADGTILRRECVDDELVAKGLEEGKYAYFKAEGELMKAIRVVAAIICDNMNAPTKIFATARGYGDLKGGWEFPGGKIEPDEAPEDAIKREIIEELDTKIVVGKMIHTIEYDYPTFHLSMDCFLAEVEEGNLELKEHEAAKWLTKEMLDSVAWLPADVTLIDQLRELL